VTSVDIDYLLERLEESLTSGSKVPFSRRTLIDEEECLAILEQIREAVPEEIQRARRITQERERVLSDASERARMMLEQAEQEAAGRVREHSMVRTAEAMATDIRDEAIQAANEIRREADEYAYRVMERLERSLAAAMQTVQRGMRELERGRDGGGDAQTEPRDT
jgi:cell division septum initiation protein DivIVA